MTTKILITFLGRTPKGQNGYRTTRYDFGDGSDVQPLAFFGWALRDRLQPDRMVILGTKGSMWDHLFEGDFDLGDAREGARLELAESVENQAVSQAQLDALAPELARYLDCEVVLRLIPYCHNETEQVELLDILASQVGQGDRVDIDITHGFRHLPMVALLAALHLQQVRKARINDIWYGAFDPDTGKAPVMRLRGLLHIAGWLEALSIYGQTGDYGVFASLIGGEIGDRLAEASFLESVNRIGQARSALKKALTRLDELAGDPALELFHYELTRRIGWAQGENYYQRQRQLALESLDRERYLDAILKGWEAFTTRLLRESGENLDPDNHAHREQARQRFEKQECSIQPRSQHYRAYDSLRRLRNAVAHGSQPKGEEVQRALGNAAAMRELLTTLFETLLPEEET